MAYSKQFSESRDWIVQPHELATLNEMLLLTPYGFCQVRKFQLYDAEMRSMLLSAPKVIHVKVTSVTPSEATGVQVIPNAVIRAPEIISNNFNFKKNKGARIMSIEERKKNANKRIRVAEQQRLLEQRKEQGAQRKKDNRRNYIIGELVTRYFPSVQEYEPGTDAENQIRFEPLKAFLYLLSTDYELVEDIQNRSAKLMAEDPDGEWRTPM